MANQGIQIELDNKCPLQSDYQELLASILEENHNANVLQYETFCQSFNIIAAYDQGKLVGLGRAVEQMDHPKPACDITILQQYRNREIDSYMRKLLSIR
ncbi:hypothetical protein SAMN03159341_103406 [Paenibacillus sp. 1_12]|uniref:hypothetical protein n=1 Tax=Paenibacillus sp. 1_12 TaxID=1566278 RepID=UPI0008EB4173|nr:hypothetical protein [Paenibacillus sp. 1_12]SFL13347.1 hypothetical protein SAMN03159341_103406 [Paenibacillus sp. 1_12]